MIEKKGRGLRNRRTVVVSADEGWGNNYYIMQKIRGGKIDAERGKYIKI